MKPKKIQEANVVYGEGQPEYKPLPAHKTKEGQAIFCFELDEAEPGTEAYAELWEQRFNEAKLGACAYRDKCPIYARTAKKGIQQNLFAQL